MNSKYQRNIIRVCSILAEQENLKVTVNEAGKGALIAGAGVFVGGLLGGPMGMAIGGTLSSIAVGIRSRGKFKSVLQIITDMSDEQKKRLCIAVERALTDIRPEDVVGALTLVLTSSSIKEIVLRELGQFFMKELGLKMIR